MDKRKRAARLIQDLVTEATGRSCAYMTALRIWDEYGGRVGDESLEAAAERAANVRIAAWREADRGRA